MYHRGLSEADDETGRLLTSQDESLATRKLGSPVGYLRMTNRVQFRGYNWRGSSAPGLPMRQHMVDSIYRVHHEREVVEVSVRSWSGSRGMRALDDSFGFVSLVAVHAMDFLHSASGVPLEEARRLTEQSLGAIDDLADPSMLVVGDVRCEARVAGGAVISLAVRPSKWIFDDLEVELLVASG